jgi:cystathionine beta-lyase
MKRRHNWDIQSDWVVTVPGVVPAVNIAISTFTEKGDGILIQRPVYHPFTNAILGSGRKLVNNSLVLEGGRYEIDFADFRQKIIDNDVKLFILCSPHNPVGRVWTQEELKTMADICLEHNVLIVSDEIHHDLAFPGNRHYPLPTVRPEYRDITIVCTAPSKTFNLAGLQASNILISNPELRDRYVETAFNWGLVKLNTFGLVACEAAYTHGDKWLDEVMTYVRENAEFVERFTEVRLPKVKLIEPEGLFLLWLDLNGLGLAREALDKFIIRDARLWLIQGCIFGEEGSGFVRLNAACSRALLTTALEQLEEAVNNLAK